MLKIWKWHICILSKSTTKESSTFTKITKNAISKTWWLHPFKNKSNLIIKISSNTYNKKWSLTSLIISITIPKFIQKQSLDILHLVTLRTLFRNVCQNMVMWHLIMSIIRYIMISLSTSLINARVLPRISKSLKTFMSILWPRQPF